MINLFMMTSFDLEFLGLVEEVSKYYYHHYRIYYGYTNGC